MREWVFICLYVSLCVFVCAHVCVECNCVYMKVMMNTASNMWQNQNTKIYNNWKNTLKNSDGEKQNENIKRKQTQNWREETKRKILRWKRIRECSLKTQLFSSFSWCRWAKHLKSNNNNVNEDTLSKQVSTQWEEQNCR